MDFSMVSEFLNGNISNGGNGSSGNDTLIPSAPTLPESFPGADAPDPQMVEKATRRRFTSSYKLSILEQVDACRDRGEVGALLRREGLYYSTLANFRKQRASGELASGASKKKRSTKDLAAIAHQIELEREVRQLRRQLARAEEIITIQKKAALLLGETLQDMEIGSGED